MTKITFDNNVITISGCPRRVLSELADVCSYKVAGYFWAPAYKNGYWDGREHLLRLEKKTQQYKVPIGLLEDVLAILKDNGEPCEVVDERSEPELIDVTWTGEKKPRRYQLRAIKAVWDGGIINMPIRSGKTFTAAALIALTRRSTIFIVPSKQLLHQTRAALQKFLGQPVGIVGDSEYEVHPITVASVQTLARMNNLTLSGARTAALERWPKVLATINKTRAKNGEPRMDEDEVKAARAEYLAEAKAKAEEGIARWAALRNRFAMLVMDECHHLTADEWQKAVNQLGCRYRVGLSATAYPDRAKEQAKGVIWLRAICGPLRIQITMSELIEQGFLAPTRIIWHEILEPRRVGARWSQRLQSECILLNEHRNGVIADYAAKYAAGGHRILIVSNRHDHVEQLSTMVEARGVRHNVVIGEHDMNHRSRAIAELIDGTAPVIIGTVFGEGVDIPEVDVVINAEGGQDDITTVQRLRCLTKTEGKELAIVVDFNDRTNKYFERHSRARMRVYRAESAFEIVEVKSDRFR